MAVGARFGPLGVTPLRTPSAAALARAGYSTEPDVIVLAAIVGITRTRYRLESLFDTMDLRFDLGHKLI